MKSRENEDCKNIKEEISAVKNKIEKISAGKNKIEKRWNAELNKNRMDKYRVDKIKKFIN